MAKSENYAASAKIVDGMLILSLLDAIHPVVWQMEMGQSKSSALEVREKDGNFVLVLKTPRQDIVEIAPYAEREKAVRALIAVTKAMERAQGQMRPAGFNYREVEGYAFSDRALPVIKPQTAANISLPSATSVAKVAGGLFVIVALIVLVSLTPSKQLKTFETKSAAAPAVTTGEPMSADDFLNAVGE